MPKITLHAEIQDILIANDNDWMTTREIAEQVNRRGLYRKKDGNEVTAFQIHARTRKRPKLFKREGSRVRCLQLP